MIHYEIDIFKDHKWQQARDDDGCLVRCTTFEEAMIDKKYFYGLYDQVRVARVERTIVDTQVETIK